MPTQWTSVPTAVALGTEAFENIPLATEVEDLFLAGLGEQVATLAAQEAHLAAGGPVHNLGQDPDFLGTALDPTALSGDVALAALTCTRSAARFQAEVARSEGALRSLSLDHTDGHAKLRLAEGFAKCAVQSMMKAQWIVSTVRSESELADGGTMSAAPSTASTAVLTTSPLLPTPVVSQSPLIPVCSPPPLLPCPPCPPCLISCLPALWSRHLFGLCPHL